MNKPLPDPHLLNGQSPAAMEAIAADIAATPAKAKVAFPVTSTWEGATRIRGVVPGFELAGQTIERPHRLQVDEPSELLGSDEGPNPQQLLLTALASCLSITMVDHATMMGIGIDSLEVEVRGELDLRGVLGLDADIAPGFAELSCRVRIRADASRDRLSELLAAACALSPTYWQLGRSADIHTTLVVLDGEA